MQQMLVQNQIKSNLFIDTCSICYMPLPFLPFHNKSLRRQHLYKLPSNIQRSFTHRDVPHFRIISAKVMEMLHEHWFALLKKNTSTCVSQNLPPVHNQCIMITPAIDLRSVVYHCRSIAEQPPNIRKYFHDRHKSITQIFGVQKICVRHSETDLHLPCKPPI